MMVKRHKAMKATMHVAPPQAMIPPALLGNRFIYTDVRSPVRQANGIRCEVKFDAKDDYWSFLATPNDVEPHGRAIYAECDSGRWGPVPDYYPSDAELIAAAVERISTGLRIATTAITRYQDRIDIDDATQVDIALLKAWKIYRVGLNRIVDQPDYPHRLTWPVPPDLALF